MLGFSETAIIFGVNIDIIEIIAVSGEVRQDFSVTPNRKWASMIKAEVEPNEKKKPVIGLTGQIAAGKSLVAGMLGELGCAVIHADLLAHEILAEAETKIFLRDRFGDGVLGPAGEVDRKALADIVFADSARKGELEGFIHPRVIRRQRELVRQYRTDPNCKAVVIEVPLLLETGLKEECDWIIVVEAGLSIRQARVGRNRNWSEKELSRREKFLYSIYLKRSVADAIVYNNSTIDACRQQVEKIFSRILSSVTR
jgi:dephospho-CoA kinase